MAFWLQAPLLVRALIPRSEIKHRPVPVPVAAPPHVESHGIDLILFIVMAILVGPKVHLGHLPHGSGWVPVTWAIALVISGGGLSWANTASDYSRYLARSTSARQVFWCSSFGGFLPTVLLEVLGAAVASATASASDPIAGIPAVLPGWVSVPYLLFAIVTLLAVNTLDLYSSGLTLQAAGLRLARWQCVLVDTVLCTALCFLVIFSGQFNKYYSDFPGLCPVTDKSARSTPSDLRGPT